MYTLYIMHMYTYINIYIHIETAIAHKNSIISLTIIPLGYWFFSLIHFFSMCTEHCCVLDTIISGRDLSLPLLHLLFSTEGGG